MRAIYRLSPAEAMCLPAAEYFALAYRLPFFPGVMQARAAVVAQPEQRAVPEWQRPAGDVREVPSTRAAIMADPVLSSVISFGGA